MLWPALIFALTALATALILGPEEGDPVRRRLADLERLRRTAVPGAEPPGAVGPPGAGDPSGDPPLLRRRSAARGSARVLAAIGARLGRFRAGRTGGRSADRPRTPLHTPAFERLQQAGIRMLPGEFLLLRVASAGGCALLGLALGLGPAAWAAGLAGYGLPALWLRQRLARRLRAFETQLPDALALVAGALRSGYSFLQALAVVSREMPDPVAGEFARVLREHKVGVPLEDALTALSRRMGSADLDLAVTAVLIQRQVGGNLAEVLERIGGTLRDRLQLLGQIRTLTSQGRLSGWIISLLPPALGLVLYVMNPGHVGLLLQHPLGWVMLAMGLLMQTTGILVIRHLVNMDV